MKRWNITIEFVNEANDADTVEDLEQYFYGLVEGWEHCYMFSVEVEKES